MDGTFGLPEEEVAVKKILKACTAPIIVELGAQTGTAAAWMIEQSAGRCSQTLLVEAEPNNFELLANSGLPAVTVFGAILDRDGETEFWASEYAGGGYGSCFKPHEGMSAPISTFHRTGPVPCFTLDSLFFSKCSWDHIDFLSADVHGAEKFVISHGVETLKRTNYLFMEAVDSRMYDGAATANELMAMLPPGWTLIERFPWNLLLRNDNYANRFDL